MYSVDFLKLMFIIDITEWFKKIGLKIIGKFSEGVMICSGLFHIFNNSKSFRRTIGVIVMAALAASLCFCVCAPTVSAEKETLLSSVDSVNLRQDKWVYSVYVDKNNNRYSAVTRYDGDEIDIEIPAELGGVPVKQISREAFCNGKYITSVVIPDSVTDIGKYAFSGCIGLSSVTFPSSLRSVGEGAFYGCRSLTGAEFPEGMTRIDNFAFFNCIHLEKAVFPSTLKSIGASSFEGCGRLESASFGNTLESIGDTAFKGCKSIKGADLSGITELGAGAFTKCDSLEKVVLGDGITEIRPETFRDCASLHKVSFGSGISVIDVSAFENCVSLRSVPEIDSLTEIRSLAFSGCVALKKAEMGKNVQQIRLGAFADCTSLTKIAVSADNENYASVNGCLYSKDGTTLILCPQGFKETLTLSEHVVSIADYAAMGCNGISEAALSEGLTAIGRAAFFGCTDMAAISLPDSVESIGSAAFGRYLSDGRIKKTEYLRVFASKGSMAEKYCADREISFTPYSDTLFTNSERVVIAAGQTFSLTSGFVSRRRAAVSWESSDESVVKVNGGRLTAVSTGNAEVTASAEGFEPCVVKVSVVSPEDIGTSKERTFDTRLIYCGESEELSSIISQIIDPIFSANRFWYSSAPSVATVTNDGKVTAHSRGTANITCRMPDGSENNVLVTVTEKPTDLSVTSPEKELVTGESTAIECTLCPSFSKDEITWESDDNTVAAVDGNGVITATGQGKCNITATSLSGLKASFAVKCVNPAESISLDREIRNVYQGKQFNLKVSVTPEDSKQQITWRSSDPYVASVNSKGKVTGKSFGRATIYAETAGGLVAECRVNVITRAEELTLDVKKLKINRGSVYKLNSIVRPSYSPETTDKCTWNSTDENVATVDENGTVTAVGAGKCIINCRTSGNLITKCQVQVRLSADSVEIKAEKDSIYIGEVLSLNAVMEPKNTTDSIEWLSDNEEVARITSGGTVKGKSSGIAVITAKLTNDVTGETVTSSFEIIVMKKADSIRLNKKSLSMLSGETDSLVFTVLPDDSNDTVRWYSTDEAVATVRSDGLITAISAGSCYICIETGSGVSARCKVTVN